MKEKFIETLLSAGFNESEIMNITNMPKSTLYRLVKKIKDDKYSLYNLSKSNELKKEITSNFCGILEDYIFEGSKGHSIPELLDIYKKVIFLNSDINYTHVVKVCCALRNFANGKTDAEFDFYLNCLLRDFIAFEYVKIAGFGMEDKEEK